MVFGPRPSLAERPGCQVGPASGKTCRFATGAPAASSRASDLRLGIERVEALRLAGLPVARLRRSPARSSDERRMLGIAEIAAAELEQPNRGGAAVEVAARCGDQAGQQRRAHDLHLFADRIGEPPVAAAERLRLVFRNEAPGHRFVEPARRGRAADPPFDQLRSRVAVGLATPGRALERRRGHLVVADDPRDFLDQVGRPFDVTPPGRNRHLVAARRSKPRLSRISRWRCLGDVDPAERLGPAVSRR